MIYFGERPLLTRKIGERNVVKVYQGGDVVWMDGYDRAPYLLFVSGDEFTIGWQTQRKTWDGVLEYSTDAKAWATFSHEVTVQSAGGKLYFRGAENTVITGSAYVLGFVITAAQSETVECYGNIEALLDHEEVKAGRHPTMGAHCFSALFRNNSALKRAPALSAVVLSDGCYHSMFYGCTSLTSAPALPAKTLAGSCYYYMFRGCTSLTSAPALPATTLAGACYGYMFYDCTSLTSAPALPAKTLAAYCYQFMFRGCTSLTSPPALPATTLAGACYYYMFYGCTALAFPPELPAMAVPEMAYEYMFYGCTALVRATKLPATSVAGYGYYMMFNNCENLIELPLLAADELPDRCYYSMFGNCGKIKLSETQTGDYQTPYRIPAEENGTETGTDPVLNMFVDTGGTFTGTPAINKTYYTSNTVVE